MNGEMYFKKRFYPRILIMEPVPIEAIPMHEIDRAGFPSCSNASALLTVETGSVQEVSLVAFPSLHQTPSISLQFQPQRSESKRAPLLKLRYFFKD